MEDNKKVKDDSKNTVKKKVDNTKSIVDAVSGMIDDISGGNVPVTGKTVDLLMEERILVKSINHGGLSYRAKSNGATFRWDKFGAVLPMKVSEIVEMNNHKKAYLSKPYVILMDERAIDYFQLRKLYENVAKIGDLDNLFQADFDTIKTSIDNILKADLRDVLISKVRIMIDSGKLTNIKILKLLEEKLMVELVDIVMQQGN